MSGLPSLKTFKNSCCVDCRTSFYIKDFTFRNSKCPMVLHCGHSICEGCLHQILKVKNTVKCQHCGFISSTNAQIPVSESFPFNTYVIGSVISYQNYRYARDAKIIQMSKSDDFFTYKILPTSKSKSEIICEECSMEAIWYCENCKSNLCEGCWSKIHVSAKSLMKHCKSVACEIELDLKYALKKCPVHENMDLEFFCKDCSTTVCSHCVIVQHQGAGHSLITLKEKNVEMVSHVVTAAEKAETVYRRMKQSLQKIKGRNGSSETSNQRVFIELGNKITKNFSRIHGILQLEEERLLRQLQKNFSDRENCIDNVKTQLEKQIEKVDNLLSECRSALKRPQNLDLMDLHRQLTEIEDLPCYLIMRNQERKDLKIEFDSTLVEMAQLYCTMDLPPSQLYELCSQSNLPENYVIEPLPTSSNQKSKKFLEFLSDVDSLSSDSQSSPEVNASPPEAPKDSKSRVFVEKRSYSVRVSFIKNPEEFYITLNSLFKKQQEMESKASKFALSSSDIPKSLAKDEIYLVQFVDDKWYRARVVEVLSDQKIDGEDCVLVYYIDYGNSETVPISRLRYIPPEMLEEPPFAVKCKLFDSVPKNDSEWCDDATKTMEKILENHVVTMYVMKRHNDCLEVDLSVIYPEGEIGRDIVSVRDALVFLDYSSFVRDYKIPRSLSALKYLPQYLPSKGEIFDAVVTYVNSPFDFFVQNIKQDAPYLYKLTIDLQKYCEESSENNMIYNPVRDMPCAARFTADQKWYRARIIDVPGQKMVSVYYVDYGNKETIPWTSIRKLKEGFMKRAPLALNCTLGDVLPVDVFWNDQSISYLEGCVMTKGCRIHILNKPKHKQKIKVLLYHQVKKKEVCVNSVFIEKGYAIKSNTQGFRTETSEKGEAPEATAMVASTFFVPKEDKSNSDGEENKVNLEVDDSDPMMRAFKRDPRRPKLTAKELRKMYEYEKKIRSTEVFSTDEVENEIGDDTFRMRVEVFSAQSPSDIYVTFPTLKEELRNLQVKIDEFYRDTSPVEGEKWTKDSLCAVYDFSKASWYRAVVLRVLPDDFVEVFMKDVGKVSVEPVSALRKLDPSFKKYPTCAIKCHLADIISPGSQWPTVTCEFLLTEIERYRKIYMTKKGEIENKSLPVELWIHRVVSSGALEPIKKEWITLNRLLVQQGLAIPTRPKLWDASISANGESLENEKELKAGVELIPDEDVGEASNYPSSSFSSQWKPPEPLKRSRFVGLATYVDMNGLVYAYDVEKDEKDLKMIREILVKEFTHTKPNPEDSFRSPGQMCVARYHLDNLWYRGKIIKINEDSSCEVLFVDYGNVETCQASDLRKKIELPEIPILTHKFKLHKIEPMSNDGSWPVSVVDTLHALVVEKKCEIVVLKSPVDPTDTYLATVKIIESGIDIGMFLVNKGLAFFKSTESDSSGSSEADGLDDPFPDCFLRAKKRKPESHTEGPRSIFSKIPNNCSGLFIRVTSLISETEFYANIVEEESLSPKLKKVLNKFQNLLKNMMQQCRSQPLLKDYTKGQPCCSVCSKNNKWCRAEIDDFIESENLISVYYIDSGFKEFRNKELIFECKPEWMTLPRMAVKFRLVNVKRHQGMARSLYMKALTTCLKGSVLFAEILSKEEDIFNVRLLTNKNGALAYKALMDKKIMVSAI